MSSMTTRTLDFLREKGFTVAVVEKWNSYVKVRQDLWGFADIIAFNRFNVLLVQTTSGPNVLSRIKKTLAEPRALLWAEGPGRRIFVIGWTKKKVPGMKKQEKYYPRFVEILKGGDTLEHAMFV